MDQPLQNIIVQLINQKKKGYKSNKIEQLKEKDNIINSFIKA